MKTKFRNLILALICLAVFGGVGVFLSSTWLNQRPFSIIVILSPNLTSGTLAASRLYAGGTESRLALESMSHLALARNSSNDAQVSDLSAAASAIATGVAGNNGHLASSPSGEPLPTLLSMARDRNRSVGLITTGSVLSPTLAAFFAPGGDPKNKEQLGTVLFETARPDLLMGGGLSDLLPDLKGGTRRDGKDLLLQARQSGYDIVRNRAELESTPAWRAPKLLGIFANEDLAFAGEFGSAGSQPSLPDMIRSAIQLLQFNRNGYLLVVDASLAGKASSANAGERLLQEIIELDRAVAAALQYSGENTLLVVAGTLNMGGFQLTPGGFPSDSGIAILGKSTAGVPAGTWATGPGATGSEDRLPGEPVAVLTPTSEPVAEDMLIFSQGTAAQPLQGVLDNTRVFEVLNENL